MIAMTLHHSGKVPRILHPDQSKLNEWGGIFSEDMNAKTIPVIAAWQLNERMYGELQGLNKEDARARFGVEQVHKWRRSYADGPPKGESLKMTAERAIPYFEEEIVPLLAKGQNVFISAHGNSLRGIIKDLDKLSDDEVVALELGTGVPIIYEYENGSFKKIPA
jgi:2,3-bisphosphoglycerate-dependent phosphoglycerate mutase